jgi:hypothetical protein
MLQCRLALIVIADNKVKVHLHLAQALDVQ